MKTIQLAFQEAIELISKDLGLKKEKVQLYVKCTDKHVKMMARNKKREIKEVPLERMIGTKMMVLRMTAEKLNIFFRTVQIAFVRSGNLPDPDAVSLVLYFSKVAKEIVVTICVGTKPEKKFPISELMRETGLAAEELN